MRSLPGKRKKAGSTELINRGKFKAVLSHLEPLKYLVKAGFKVHYTKTGGYRAAFAYNRKHAITGDGTVFRIAPELFRFSGGDLPGALDPAVVLTNGTLEITWDTTSVGGSNPSDQMMVLLYDAAHSVSLTIIFDGPFRREGTYSINVPSDVQGVQAEVYIGLVAADALRLTVNRSISRTLNLQVPMDIKVIIWIYLPLLLGIVFTIVSVWALFKRRSANEMFLFLLLASANGLAVYALMFMILSKTAFPSAIPHMIVAVTFIIFLIRGVISLIRKRFSGFNK